MWWRDSGGRARAKHAERAQPGPLRDLLNAPQASASVSYRALRALAVDIETTGLEPRTDRIVSIGWVPINGAEIVLSGAAQIVVTAENVGQSAGIHGITDDMVAGGVPVEEAVAALLTALHGRVLIAHHAPIEIGFLSQVTRAAWGAPLAVQTVDTMELADRLTRRGFDSEPGRGSLRLDAARQVYGLPRYRAHDALTDALACAELYLAQAAQLSGSAPATVKTLTTTVKP